MKRWTKKLMVLAMTLTMLLGLVVPAQAATLETGGGNVVTTTGTVTVTGFPSDKTVGTNGVSFATYQIIYATFDSSSNALEYHLTDWAKTALVESGQYASEAEALEALAGMGTQGTPATEQAALLNKLAAAANKTAYTAAWTKSTAGTTVTAELPVGSYLVIPSCADMAFLNMMVSVNAEKGAGAYDWVTQGTTSVLKGNELTVDKKITASDGATDNVKDSAAAAAIGDTLQYEIGAEVPHFPANAQNTIFKIVDTPKNIGILENTVKAYGVNNGTATELSETAYTVTVDPVTGALTVDFSDNYFNTFYNNGTYPYTSVKVTYDAKLLASAEVGTDGNSNKVILEYGNDPYTDKDHTTKVEGPEPHVYTYGLDLTKYGENEKLLADAVFSLYEGTSTTPLKFIEVKDGDKVVGYKLTNDPAATGTTTELKTDAEGKLHVEGLDASVEYVLKEVKAPAGYSLNTNVLHVTITAKADESGAPTSAIESVKAEEFDAQGQKVAEKKSWTQTETGFTGGKFEVSLTDTKLPQLPATGGIGTTIFTVAGVLLMLAALVMFFAGKKRKSE